MEMKLEDDAAFMDKYSRQIGAYGIETMAKLVKLKVLIVGVNGVGIECAKNLILAGPGAVTIYDDGITEPKDLGSNFFLKEDDIGKPRAPSVVHKLAELNQMVNVTSHSGPLTEEIVAKHNLVVFTNTRMSELIRWNEFCRSHQPTIGFILCDIRGAIGYVFTDFGDHFITHDATGENPITRIITNITNEEEGLVSLLGPDEDGKMHELPDSDHDGWVEISDVDGMQSKENPNESINTCGPWRIKFAKKKIVRTRNGKQEEAEVFDPYRLRIGNTLGFEKYNGGGVLTQHKKPYATSFRSLEETLRHPISPGDFGLMFTDGAKLGRAEQIHMAMYGIMEYEERHGKLPQPHNMDHVKEVFEYASKGPTAKDGEEPPFKVEELDPDVVEYATMYAAIELHPMAAFFGGIVAQEIVKFTGKFTPLKQWMHFDAFEVLPDKSNRPSDTQPIGSRYDHMIMAFGQDFLKRLGNIRTFLVGCGALGCEYLKNFAMVGLACGENGLVTVTDNDRIEVSNLNRQFLFRERNVGQPKSVAATEAVKLMNQTLKVQALEHLVAPNTENIFHDQFWNELDFITNALDNVKARLYVDSKCVFYKKPLLESGTLGTKCNVQVVIPHKTQSYADGPKDAEDDNIPMCTLRNFPSLIEHCIEWSRAQFEDTFVVPFGEAKKFIDDPQGYIKHVRDSTLDHPNPRIGLSSITSELERIENLLEVLKKRQNLQFQDCIEMALDYFHQFFRDRILQLIHNFPEDHVTNAGEKFWSGAKRFPQAAIFDPKKEEHMTFLISTANLLAVGYGLIPPPEEELISLTSEYRNFNMFEKIVSKIPIHEWKPTNEKIAGNDEELKQMEEEKTKTNDNESRNHLIEALNQLEEMKKKTEKQFYPADFEKDQDLNFHIDFIYAASNLRAWNYRIRGASRHRCKMIAGKIIPAIATTTASVTGLAMLELLKIVQNKDLEAFKDSSNSLGLNMYLMQEPAPPEKAKDEYDVIEMTEVKCQPSGFTKWDNTLIEIGDVKMGELLNGFKEKTGLNCDLLFHAVAEIGESDDPKYKAISGLMLYDKNTFSKELKELYEKKKDMRLVDWIQERYQGIVDCTSNFVELQTSCTDDDGNAYKVPTLIYKYK